MPKTKKFIDTEEQDEEDKDEDIEERWDIKKILMGLVVVGFIIGGYYFFLRPQLASITQSVLGTFTSAKPNVSAPSINPEKDLNNLINEATKKIDDLTPDNVSSSAGELQNILDDIKALQEKKKEPKDVFCDYVCKEK